MHVTHLAALSISLSSMTAVGHGSGSPEDLIARLRQLVHTDTPAQSLRVEQERFEGVIRKIDESAKTVSLNNSRGEIVTVSYDDDTTFTLNGEESTREEALKVGRDATVVYSDSKRASKIDVTQEE
jgi:hypothetical protein